MPEHPEILLLLLPSEDKTSKNPQMCARERVSAREGEKERATCCCGLLLVRPDRAARLERLGFVLIWSKELNLKSNADIHLRHC